jgi:hypothetical protein
LAARYDPAAVRRATDTGVDDRSEVSAVRVARIAVTAVVTLALAGAGAGCSSPSSGTATASPHPTVSVGTLAPPPIAGTPTVGLPSLGSTLVPPALPIPPTAAGPANLPSYTSPPITSPAFPSPAPSLSKVVLGSDGFGAVKLGMTASRAQATHLVGAASLAPGQTCPTARLLAAPSGGMPSLFFSPTLGLVAIYAYPGITTPTGIKIGSSFADLQRAYPTWRGLQGNEGVGYVPAPGSTTSEYRIAVSNGHVIELAIQLNNEDCYE